jgi:hypothetical protein
MEWVLIELELLLVKLQFLSSGWVHLSSAQAAAGLTSCSAWSFSSCLMPCHFDHSPEQWIVTKKGFDHPSLNYR